VEACLPVAGAIQATIEIALKELPAAQVAYTTTTVRQSIFPGVLKANEAIREWITSHGHTIADSREHMYDLGLR
jgi:hypothetical protein